METSFATKHRDKSEQHEKVEKAKLVSLRRSRSSQTSLLPPDLPPALAAQLVTISDTRDILSAHLASNDKKLRRLICRYTNQIQYGCKNIYCTVQSCLTCRQRKSRAPLRKYTDASARALAAHIIDEQGEKGLCHSDPVVLWLETPGTRSRTRSAEAKPKINGHAKEPANGHIVGHANAHIRRHDSKSSLGRSPAKRTPSSDPADALSSEDRDTRSPNFTPLQVLSEPVDISGMPAETTPIQLTRKDPKSFTQAIFDSFRLRSLWANPRSDEGYEAPTLPRASSTDGFFSLQEALLNGAHNSPCDGDLNPDDDQQKDEVPSKLEGPNSDGHGTFPNRPRTFKLHSSHTKSSEYIKTDLLSQIPDSSRRIGGAGDAATETEPDFIFESQTMPERSRSGNEPRRKLESSHLEVTSEENDETAPAIQVAPFLSYELLTFLLSWKFGTLHKDSKPWTGKCAPEPYGHFVRNSMFFCLKDPWRTLQSIRDWHEAEDKTDMYENNDFSATTISAGITLILHVTPLPEVLRTLRLTLIDAYNPPLTWRTAAPIGRKPSRRQADRVVATESEKDGSEHKGRLSNEDAARLCAFGLLLLLHKFSKLVRADLKAISPRGDPNFLLGLVRMCNGFARVLPTQYEVEKDRADLQMLQDSVHNVPYRNIIRPMTELIDYFQDYDAGRLFSRIAEVIAARHTYDEISKSRQKSSLTSRFLKGTPSVAALVASYLASYNRQTRQQFTARNLTILTIEWTKLLFTRDWDGNAVISKATPLGGSLQLLMAIFTESRIDAMDPSHFHIPLLAERLSMVEMPVDWLSFRADNKNVHLLSYSFLFEPQVLVSYFRAINHNKMSKAVVDARAVEKDIGDFTDRPRYPQNSSNASLLMAMRPYTTNTFVLTVRRDNMLEDAINQVWRRQRREFLRPLKVRMGMDEGEEGVDIGGIQQEFFRILFAQVLDPSYGMFTLDDRTRMAYFKPGALEPLYKFEVIGVFMSLALYNSITLPITFPLAFYRRLLGLKVKKIHHIADGWPELAKGLGEMLKWTDGDVSDVFARTYEFSYEAFGKHVNIDMKKFDKHTPWPPSERKKGKEKAKTTTFEDLALNVSAETNAVSNYTGDEVLDDDVPMVTNTDRHEYVRDYIIWLTHRSVEEQYKAFSRGFYTCLDRTALSIFTPEALKTVVEGHSHIDVDGLEAAALYESGYNASDATIQDFWHVVRSFSPDQIRHLLEFVTASDRVPVNGIKSVQFVIQRNGDGDERLPTSTTCFGRLLLPKYSSRGVLEEKLTKAIENSEGFGFA